MVASRLRALSFAGLAATSAAVAHGGVSALSDPAWALPALAGSAVATAVLLAGWRLVAARGEHASEASLAALIPAMLVAQGAAHLALLAAGTAAHGGANGSLALHLSLAVVAAWLVHRIDRHTVATAARALAGTVRPRPTAPQRPTAIDVPSGTACATARGRAPPLTA
ncbi:MAG TPA: hypothetical protein VFH74_03000 [Gaiellales bacterium]|nr:hypothetical protein [Gaiellales bacterium]